MPDVVCAVHHGIQHFDCSLQCRSLMILTNQQWHI